MSANDNVNGRKIQKELDEDVATWISDIGKQDETSSRDRVSQSSDDLRTFAHEYMSQARRHRGCRLERLCCCIPLSQEGVNHSVDVGVALHPADVEVPGDYEKVAKPFNIQIGDLDHILQRSD